MRNILKSFIIIAAILSISVKSNAQIETSIIEDELSTIFFLPIVNQDRDSLKILLSRSIDSVSVEYSNSTNLTKYLDYIISFSNDNKIMVKSGHWRYPSITITIDSLDLIKSFVTYINDFYIDKTKNIILQKRRTNIMVSSDWPSIEVIGYKKGIKIFDKHIWLTEEYDDYRIVFNPEFLEFCELIKLLANYVDKESNVRCK